jgi:hypothetical protein
MATSIQNNVLAKAYGSADSTMARFIPVKLGTANGEFERVTVCTAVTDKVIGITNSNAVSANQSVDVAFAGYVTAYAEGGITKGDYVSLGSSDQTKVKTITVASSGTQQTLIGVAENTVSTDEQVTIKLLLIPIYT